MLRRLSTLTCAVVVNLLSRFKASLDGNPDSSNPYIKYYVPFCLKTPILTQVAIHTAACFLSETGHLDERVAMAHKGLSIRLLNDHLRSESSSSDEVIAAVIQLIVDEWYWGETNDLRAHLRGLREMIRLRGGFRNLGLYGLISRLAIMYALPRTLSFHQWIRVRLADDCIVPTTPSPSPSKSLPSSRMAPNSNS